MAAEHSGGATRRELLWVGCAWAGVAWLGCPAPAPDSEGRAAGSAPAEPEPAEPELAEARRPAPEGVEQLLAESEALLRQLADAIVPREGEHPGAGELDLLPALSRWIEADSHRLAFYRASWPRFAEIARSELGPTPSPEAVTALCGDWLRAWAGGARGAPMVFEQLRLDVLRVYYASAEGWRALGFPGPAHLSREQMERG